MHGRNHFQFVFVFGRAYRLLTDFVLNWIITFTSRIEFTLLVVVFDLFVLYLS